MNQPPQSNAAGHRPGEQPYSLPGLSPDTTQDAVVVVPGIMGSELYDTATNTVLWGLANPGWLGRAWTTRQGLAPCT